MAHYAKIFQSILSTACFSAYEASVPEVVSVDVCKLDYELLIINDYTLPGLKDTHIYHLTIRTIHIFNPLYIGRSAPV